MRSSYYGYNGDKHYYSFFEGQNLDSETVDSSHDEDCTNHRRG